MLERWLVAALIIAALAGARLLHRRLLSTRHADESAARFDACLKETCSARRDSDCAARNTED